MINGLLKLILLFLAINQLITTANGFMFANMKQITGDKLP